MTDKKGFNLNKFYSKIYKRYDLINNLFTFGLDRKWRKETIQKTLEDKPKNVLDLCCGTGDLAISLAQESNSTISVTGYDMNVSMLEVAKLKAKKNSIENINFLQGNAAKIPFEDDTFDSITIGFGFRNLTFNNPNENKHISEIYRVLKPGGKLLILESGLPDNMLIKFMYKIYLYLFLIPLGGLFSGDFKAYWYLAHSSSKFYSTNEIKELLSKNEFKDFRLKKFLFGSANLIINEK